MNRVSPPGLLLLSVLALWGCKQHPGEEGPPEMPNIIWLVAEDQSPEFFPMYGNHTMAMPDLEALAADGVVYNNAYAPVPVCAPARSAIITGMYPTTLGTHNMRTYVGWADKNQPEIDIPNYSPIPPQGVKMFTEYLRRAGYYCTNNNKEDYNFRSLETAWDESSKDAHWRNRPDNNPFFAVFNFGVCHESQIWERGADSLWVSPENVPVPPYFPDNDTIRHDLAVNYSNLGRLDRQVGEIIRQLKEDGLYDNSYIFFYGDHGGPFPRYKRALYETGLKVPMVIKFPGNSDAGKQDDRFMSFIDLAPTLLSVAGIEPPKVMQGVAQFGTYKSPQMRDRIYATSDRFDEVYDRLRAVRIGKFKYIRNFNTGISNALPVKYREQMPMMQSIRNMWEQGKLDSVQRLWLRTPKPEEELYDLELDPLELHNLAGERKYSDTLLEIRSAMDNWIHETKDLGAIPEKELVMRWIPESKPPRLPPLEAIEKDGFFSLKCARKDATIIWKDPASDRWEFYADPLPATTPFQAKAVRLGYADSEILENTSE